jgi:uncharacterized protein DUF4394
MTRTNSHRLHVEHLEGREVPAIIFGLTPNNQIVTFDSADTRTILRTTPIIGAFVSPGETITDIDVRTATGELFGHSNRGRLFQISPVSGFAFPVGNPIQLDSVHVGFDFDPATDRIRILTNQQSNIIREPVFGLFVRRANNLTYAPGDFFEGETPRVTGAAFTNNVPDPAFRVLFGIDHRQNALVRVGATTIDDGLLTTIGALGRDVTPRVGLDIAPVTNTMFASLQIAGRPFSRLYNMNYATGSADLIGGIGGGTLLNDIAVDLRGTSGFVSRAGFGAFAPPAFFTTGFNFSVNTSGSSPFTSSTAISPSGTTITINGP